MIAWLSSSLVAVKSVLTFSRGWSLRKRSTQSKLLVSRVQTYGDRCWGAMAEYERGGETLDYKFLLWTISYF